MQDMKSAPDRTDLELSNELLLLIARLNRWSNSNVDTRLPLTQLRLLSLIDARSGAHISTLAKDDNCTQPGMTLQIQRLEELSLVERQPDPADARAVLISLTTHGRSMLESVRGARAAAVAPAVHELNDNELVGLKSALDSLSRLLDIALTQPGPAPTRKSRN